MLLDRLSLKEKLWLLTTVALISLCATVVVGAIASSSLSRSTSDLSNKYLVALSTVASARNDLSRSNAFVFKFVNEVRSGQTNDTLKEKMGQIRTALTQTTKKSKEADDALALAGASMDRTAKEKPVLLQDISASYEKTMSESLDAILSDVTIGGMMLMSTEEDYSKAELFFNNFEKAVKDSVFENAQKANQLAQRAQWMLIAAGIIGLLVFSTIAILTIAGIRNASQKCLEFTSRVAEGDLETKLLVKNRRDEFGKIVFALEKMQSRLQEKANAAVQIAEGNLAVEIQPASDRDKLGTALIDMRNNLQSMVQGIKIAFEKVATDMSSLKKTSNSLHEISQEQAASLQQISSSVAEVNQRVRLNTQTTEQASQQAKAVRENAQQGKLKMETLAQAISHMHTSSKNVSKVIKTIDDIAFQTNLLALNASVEAARAGQHGKGFSVVANEVRNLANRSAKAASESGDLIQDSLKTVAAGLTLTQETTQSYQVVFDEMNSVTHEIITVNDASKQQSEELGQVSQGISHLGNSTTNTAAFAENVASTAANTFQNVCEVETLLSRFKVSNNH